MMNVLVSKLRRHFLALAPMFRKYRIASADMKAEMNIMAFKAFP